MNVAVRPTSLSRVVVPLQWLFSGHGSLKVRTLRGGLWLVIGDGIGRISGIAKYAVLAHLLQPSDFGVMAIAVLVTRWAETFTDTGLKSALIQRRGDISSYLNPFWTLQIIRGFLVSCLLIALSPIAASLFHQPASAPLLRLMAVVPLLGAFHNPATVYLRRELALDKEVTIRAVSNLVGLGVGIAIAVRERSVWALPWSVVAARFLETALSYFVVKYVPKIDAHLSALRSLASFSKWVFWSNVLMYCELYVDSAAVGRWLGPVALGLYQIGNQLAVLPALTFASHVGGVLFPALAKIGDPGIRRNAVLKVSSTLLCAFVPLVAAFTLFAPTIVSLIFGSRWAAAVPSVRCLVIAGALTAFSRTLASTFLSTGKPRIFAFTCTIRTIVFVAVARPAMVAGLTGVALAVVGSALVSTAYAVWRVHGEMGIRLREFVRTSRAGLISAAPIVVASGLCQLLSYPVIFLIVGGAASAALAGVQMRTLLAGRSDSGRAAA